MLGLPHQALDHGLNGGEGHQRVVDFNCALESIEPFRESLALLGREVKLQPHDGHRTELEGLLELLDVCEVSDHVAQPHEEGLKIGIDVYVLGVFP